MPIKVYGSITASKPDEVHDAGGLTISQWLSAQIPDYVDGDSQPFTVAVNGKLVAPKDWPAVKISARDDVQIRVRPKGDWVGDALSFVFPFWGGSVVAGQAVIDAIVDVPGMDRGSGQQGSNIEPAKAKANTARLNQTIPELFGQHIRYPDYLCQPRRYYKDTKTQALDLVMSIGKGDYEVDTSLLKIGDTPLDDLRNAVSYAIYAPGEALPAQYKNWYPSPEVGASTGSSGIRLQGVPESALLYSDNDATTNGDNISNIETSDLWEPGFYVLVRVYQTVTVTTDPDGDILSGNFQHLSVGQTVDIAEEDGSFGSNYPNGLFARVLTMNAGKTQMTLETTDGSPEPITDLGERSYTADVRRSLVEFSVGGVAANSINVVAEDNGGNPVSPSLPTVSGARVVLNFQYNDFASIWSGPYKAVPKGESCQSFEVDIFVPQGLGEIDGSNVNSRSRTIEIQYRDHRNGPLGIWLSETRTITGSSRDQLGWTFTIDPGLTDFQPEVRVRRTDPEDRATTSLDRIEWAALRAELPRADSYQDITTMTLTIEGSDKVANQSENRINLIPVRKLEPVGGGAKRATRSIADAVYYMAISSGYTPSRIDVAELQRLGAIWDSRGDYFDFVFNETTSKDAINTALRAGFAKLTVDNSVLVPVRDEPRTQFEQPYSPENMTAPLQRSFKSIRPEDFDGVEVEYINSDTWTTETVLCLLPGDQGIKLDKMNLDGVTDRTRAWRLGMRRRRAQRYRRWTYNFTTELDALNSNYLSYVPLIDDIPGYGKGCIIRDVDTTGATPKLIVSEPMDWQDGESYVVAYRNVEGDLVGPFTATRGDTDFEIVAPVDPLPELSPRQEPPHLFFGTVDRWSFPALITDINPQGGLEIGVTATNYDERVYADDDNVPA